MDALNDDDVEYGEVLVYEVTTDFIRLGVTECNIVSLRFTDFDGKSYFKVSYHKLPGPF